MHDTPAWHGARRLFGERRIGGGERRRCAGAPGECRRTNRRTKKNPPRRRDGFLTLWRAGQAWAARADWPFTSLRYLALAMAFFSASRARLEARTRFFSSCPRCCAMSLLPIRFVILFSFWFKFCPAASRRT